MTGTQTTECAERFLIPGTEAEYVLERDDEGRLTRLTAGGRVYAEAREGRMLLGDGLAEVAEAELPNGLLRRVHTGFGDWVEEYLWDSDRKPTSIDGTRIERDSQGRVTACRSEQSTWRYGYSGNQLSVIDGPFGTRHIIRADDGRPIRIRESGQTDDFRYCATGARSDSCGEPAGFHYDPMGRLWTVTDPFGRIQHTYLWNGLACFGRIDGPPGNPLAAVFSLDPTSTPVRIITHTNVTQIVRDAFGEVLLRHAAIPGLYSAGIHNGLMHFRSRKLDPRTGSYTSPDPLCGTERDPRRMKGFQGPLFVDNAHCGPYAVCQYDPIGRTDPTGEFSFPLFLSSLTWAWGGNIFSLLVMDATINFWFSLLGIGGQGDNVRGRFWDFEGLSASDRIGAVAFRRDGFWTKHDDRRAWTFQHTVYADQADDDADDITKTKTIMDPLDFGRVFKPETEFVPTLYGTLLKVKPSSPKRAFLLQSTYNTGDPPGPLLDPAKLVSWNRYGDSATAVIPGSRVPRFDKGGIHFDRRPGLTTGTDADLVECTAATPVTGLLKNFVTIVFNGKAADLAKDDIVLFTDLTGNAGVFTLTAVDKSDDRITYHAEPNYIPPLAIPDISKGVDGELRSMGATAKSTETLTPALDTALNPIGDRLNLPAAGPDYAPNDPLRLTQNGADMGVAMVKADHIFEAQLKLDAPIDPSLVAPPDLSVSTATADPAIAAVSAKTVLPGGNSQLDFSPADAPKPTAPAVSIFGAATVGAAMIPVVLTPTGNPKVMQADRDLSALGVAGTTVSFQQFKKDVVLGSRVGPPENAAILTYNPTKGRTAPSAGTVLVEDSANKVSLRAIASKVYDAVVLAAPIKLGSLLTPYTVDVLAFDGRIDLTPCNLTYRQEIKLDAATDLTGFEAFQLFRLQAATLPTSLGSQLAAAGVASLTGATATVSLSASNLPSRPTPGQVVAVQQGATVKLAVVKNVFVTLKVDRQIVSKNTQDFKAVPIAVSQPQNDGAFVAARQITVLLTLTDSAGTVKPAAMPTYRIGEQINISSDKGSFSYKISNVVGNALTLDPTVGPNLNAAAKNIVITRGSSPIEWPFDAEQVSGTTITAFPTDRDSRLPGGGRVQMPQFHVGELVKANWGGAAPDSRHYRITAVRGTTIDVADDAALPANTPDLVVVRLDVADPQTGTSLLGFGGTMKSPVPAPAGGGLSMSDTFEFNVWQPSDFNSGNLIAIADKEEAHGAVIVAGPAPSLAQVNIDFVDAPGLSGNVQFFALNIQDQGFSAAAPDQPDDHSTASFINQPVLSAAGGGMVVVLPYSQSAHVHGVVTAGTQKVPEEISFEIGRRQTLIDHELTHTRQMLHWGQLIFCYFPVWLLEGIADLAGSSENLPRFSAYAKATVTKDGSRNLLKIEAGSTVEFKDDDQVEISTDGKGELYNLGKAVEGSFPLAHVGSPTTDQFSGITQPVTVFVRRVQGGGGAAQFWKWFMASQRVLTIGGLSKIGFGGVWGGLAFLLGKLSYFLYRKLGGEDDSYLGTVDDKKTSIKVLTTLMPKFSNASFIRVKKGDDTRIRELDGVEIVRFGGPDPPDPQELGDQSFLSLKLKAEIDFTDAVQVSPYSSQDAFSQWDWNTNYPARIPDPSRPARIKVDSVGKDKFSARQFDRVSIRDENTSQVFYVTNVEDDGTIDLNRAPFATAPSSDHIFQISSFGVIANTALADLNPSSTAGKVGEVAATVFFDPLNVLHMSWMRYLIDPFGQFKPEAYRRGLRTETGWGKFFTGLTWLARYALSTESWGLLPFFGFFWWDHVFGGKSGDKDYLAEMEQDASEESGNIYSHLSRIVNKPTAVGDIGQFWFFVHGGTEFAIETSGRDAPGVRARAFTRISPLVEDSGAGKGADLEPNIGFETAAASKDTGGLILPDLLTKKPATAGNSAPVSSPLSWQPSDLAQIPVGQELQCAIGNYVAFTAPGKHRVTIRNSSSESDAGECQRSKKHFLGIFEEDETLQTVFFDVEVKDLVITIGGIPVANDDGITLLQRQVAAVVVRDQPGRDLTSNHQVFTSQSRLDIQGGVGQITAGRTNTASGELAEIVRVYTFQNGKFDDSALGPGMHLAKDLAKNNLLVPVRNFSVTVTDAPAVVKTVPDTIPLDLYTQAAPELHPNETVFVLVPSPFIQAGTPTFEYPVPPNPLPPDPSVTVVKLTDLSGFSKSVRDFLGLDGRIISVQLNPNPAPVGDPFLKIPITVGPAGDSTIVTARIPLRS